MAKLTKKQKKRLKAARSDKKITKREAKSLRDLGISKNKISNNKQGTVKHSKAATKALSRPKPQRSSGPSRPPRSVSYDGQPRGYRDPRNINPRNTTGSSSGRGRTAENRNASSMFSELYKFSEGAVDAAARAAGIKNINSPDEVRRILRQLNAGGPSKRGTGKNNKGADRSSGEYDDIRAAQGEDQAAGQQAAAGFRNAEANVGGISPEVQAQLDALTLSNMNLTSSLNGQADFWAGRIDEMGQANNDALARMEGLMLQQQESAASAQELLRSQLETTQSALLKQQQRSANLARAYVPAPEQSALNAAYGDLRTSTRRRTNNSLNDLSIVTGIGGSNSLSGLTLA